MFYNPHIKQLEEVRTSSEEHTVMRTASFIKFGSLSLWENFFWRFHEWTSLGLENARWEQVLDGSLQE